MDLGSSDLLTLPEDAAGVCDLADAFLRNWLADVQVLTDDERQPVIGSLRAAESGLGTLPTALRWAYQRFGSTGTRLFNQDPLVHIASLRADAEGVVPFRKEQQGCVEWGYVADGGSDPAVLMKDLARVGEESWEPHQDRLSIHILEGVLSEAIFSGETHAANAEASDAALAALQKLDVLSTLAHPFWPGQGSVTWHGVGGGLVRNDADTWLWALARSADDLDVLTEAVPGDWVLADN